MKMSNGTNRTDYYWSSEYYWDYVEPASVDGRKLVANKHSIVIALWVGLAAFVVLLFLILLYMSRSGSVPRKRNRYQVPENHDQV
ncbi:melanocortin-2 receptor accessory protein [Ambystoma mexicanum]|uniref:melanocortin-2 receptor accessory protein n=1 Tax=Ambystoma mexicanum TaxID=8296 RepID=UPI0037E8F475